MKKYLKYILILVIISFFIPIFKTEAQEVLGTCYSNGNTYQGWTQKSCKDNSGGAVWDPPGAPVGDCVIKKGNGSVENYSNYTENACTVKANSTWKRTSAIDYNYTFLAPLPCDTGPGCENNKFIKFDPSVDRPLGVYLNIMLRIFFGISAVLAVVMIVMGGIEYMTSELAHTKESGKERIQNALLGLIIAFGAYSILYTINPDLLRTDVKIENQILTADISEIITSDSGKTVPPTAQTPGCSGGVKQTRSTMFACGSIADRIDQMVDDAKKEGINLTGGGYRTIEEQTSLRIKNCNGDTTNPGASCTPATAIPGQSNHNNGLAFDLRCNGVGIQTRDNACYLWLVKNASNYGLQNLNTAYGNEPWHWSVDGR